VKRRSTVADTGSENMVLRTIYLPLEVDRELKSIAFSRDVSKAELMRGFILQGLAQFKASDEKTLAERVIARVAAGVTALGGAATAATRAPRGRADTAKVVAPKKAPAKRRSAKANEPEAERPRALEAAG